MHHQTALQTEDGQWWSLAAFLAAHAEAASLDIPVRLGKQVRLAARLLATRVPQEVADQRRRRIRETARRKGRMVSADQLALAAWTILVTNVPADQLTITEARVLGRLRWQIELLFKLWKSHGQVDLVRTVQRWRLVCELYGRLLAMVVQHWVLISGCWAAPDRSLVKAAQTVRKHALGLAKALRRPARLVDELTDIARCLAAGCRVNRRKLHPNAVQLAVDPTLGEIA